MKGGRSLQPRLQRDMNPLHQHHQRAAAADDWVDGSWTVDCVCGVNFDDGEEMVNCDDCGVWVHTRCSRYVKGQDLFTCDKCKQRIPNTLRNNNNSNNNNNNNNNDSSEETEVAQLLVELPTKTIRLESARSNVNVGPVALHSPFRLWSDVPMEDRVHVQGLPGGDPALFSGLSSSIFTPTLWKCMGYVPKKFSLRYREFPCWEEEEEEEEEEKNKNEGKGTENESEGNVDKDAGVLFSLSKETGQGRSVGALVEMRGMDEESRRLCVKEDEHGEFQGLQFRVKKERSLLRPVVVQSGKQKQADLQLVKDQSARKKARAAAREVNMKKRSPPVSGAVFATSSDAKQSEFYGDRAPKSSKIDSQTTMSKNSREIGISSGESGDHDPAGNDVAKVKDDLAQIECSSEALSVDRSGHNFISTDEQKEGNTTNDDSAAVKSPPKGHNVAASLLGHGGVQISVKREEENLPPVNNIEVSAVNDVKPPFERLASAVPEMKGAWVDGDDELPSMQPTIKLEVDDNSTMGFLNDQTSLTDVRDAGVPCDELPVGSKQLSGSTLDDHASQDIEKDSEEPDACLIKQDDVLSGNACQVGREMETSEGLMLMPKEQSKSTTTSQPRTSISEERLPSTLASAVNSKSTSSDNFKDQSASTFIKDADMHEISRKTVKEHQRSSGNAAVKAPNSNKMGQSTTPQRAVSDTKEGLSDTKESVLLTSSKESPMQNPSGPSGSQQDEVASQIPNKVSVKGDKFSLSHSQPSKANHWPSTNASAPTNSFMNLSDEELALLLHQELNSSPRVPRVPRVRHAGSLPQLASPTAASMFLKRTSSSGGKDHGPFSRRKNKDVSKDAFRHSHEPDDGAKKTTNRVPSSPDRRRQDSGNPSSRRENGGSSAGARSMKKNVPPTSTSTANSGPSSSTEINDNHLSSSRNSPGNMSDEETIAARGPVHRTLPGLINEIMSKGRRMTYQELCNAVLPHWHNLRKHNGERYAYSSPSQAVLDCLRNRHEWARLVDRGPKTNSNRKRRKADTEESEDNGYSRGRSSKEGEGKSLESQREDFPKGKRKARKRKLTSQGRGTKDIKRRRKADSMSDDDSDSFSNSSDQSLSSEEEIQGGGAGSDGSEASAGSDDTDVM